MNFNPLEPPSLAILVGKESELNWEARDKLIDSITRYCQETKSQLSYPTIASFGSLADLKAGQVHSSQTTNDPRYLLASLLKINYEDILQILHTPRTQLSIRTCTFIPTFAEFLGPALFDSFSEASLQHLLKLAGCTKKIIANAAGNAANRVASLMLPQRAMNVLLAAAGEKNASVRLRVIECFKVLVERSIATADEQSLQRLWEVVGERIFGRAMGDANGEIRSLSVSLFCTIKEHLPSVQEFADKLDPSTKKQLALLLAKQNPSKHATPPPASVAKLSLKSVIQKATLKDSLNISSIQTNSSFPSSPIKSKSSDTLSLESTNRSSVNDTLSIVNEPLSSVKDTLSSPNKTTPLQPQTPHRKSPLKHAKSADSLQLSSPTPSMKHESTRPHLLQGSPMKLDHAESIYLDAISSSSAEEEDSDSEVILNVKNAVKLFGSNQKPEYRETVPISSSSLSQFGSPLQSETSTLSFTDISMSAGDSFCPELDELTIELPKKIQFHLSAPSLNPDVKKKEETLPSTPIAQRVQTLGLAASTPLRRLYRNASTTHASQSSQSNGSLLSDLLQEYIHTGDSFEKIISLSTLASPAELSCLSPDLIGQAMEKVTAANQIHAHDWIGILLAKEPALLKSSLSSVICSLESKNDANLCSALAKSVLNESVGRAVVQLCCQRLSTFRLQLLGVVLGQSVKLEELTTISLPVLLLALNHPMIPVRKLAMDCLVQAGQRLGKDQIISLLEGNGGVGDVHRRVLESILKTQ